MIKTTLQQFEHLHVSDMTIDRFDMVVQLDLFITRFITKQFWV